MQELLAGMISNKTKDNPARTAAEAYARLRHLGLLAFGEVLFDVQPQAFQDVKLLLPRMASEEVQRNWTGNSGVALLMQSMDFVRAVTSAYSVISRRSIASARVLDFGCGYGRIARLMYYFVDPDQLIGVDPWDTSIEICEKAGLGKNFMLSDYLPEELPCDGSFDLMYAFSVFTHLSERATRTCLATLRKYLATDGMLCITIRPIEYWSEHQPADDRAARAVHAHRQDGFAFIPHNRAAVDGDVTYGDTSMTPEWLVHNCPGWHIAGMDTSYFDKNQIYPYLRAA